jgi:hypothetical protein
MLVCGFPLKFMEDNLASVHFFSPNFFGVLRPSHHSTIARYLSITAPEACNSPKKTVRYRTKVQCTFVQALRLCTGRRAHRMSGSIALPFHEHGTKRGWEVSVTPPPLFTPRKDPLPVVQEAGWAPGTVWTDAKNLVPTGIRSPKRSARSQSLYRIRYPARVIIRAILIRVSSLWSGNWRLRSMETG